MLNRKRIRVRLQPVVNNNYLSVLIESFLDDGEAREHPETAEVTQFY